MTFHGESADSAFHTCLMDKVGSVHLHTGEVKPVNIYLLTEQRQEPDAHRKIAHICHGVSHLRQGIVALNHLEAVDAEVERE